MKRVLHCALVLGLVAALTSAAEAQGQGQRQRRQGQGQGQRPGGPGMGGGMSNSMLLGQESVQKDLNVTEDQAKKIKEMGEKAFAGFGALQGLSREERTKKMEEMAKESEKAVAEILKPEQVKRLKEIGIQVRQRNGMSGLLADKEVAEALKLTDDQKDKLKAFADDSRKFREEIGLGGGGGFQRPTEEQQKKLTDFRKSTDEKITKMLSDDQKAKIKEMAGAEFKGEIVPFGRRPGGGA